MTETTDGGEELLKQDSVEASANKVMKMSRNKSKENTNGRHPQNGNGAAGGGDDLESNSKSGASFKFCTKSRCLLALLMGLVIIIATVLIVIFNASPSDDKKCVLYSSPFPHVNNKLFSTKTLYATTLNFLSKEPLYSTNGNPVSLSYYAPPTPAPRVNDTPPFTLQLQANVNYVPASIQRPDIFVSDHSLKTLHEKLVKFNGCSLKQFHFYGRHAARLPNAEGITKMNNIIERIKSRLAVPAQPTPSQPDVEKQTFVTIRAATSPTRPKDKDIKPDPECFDPMARLRQWNPFAEPGQGNLITETGGQEASSMAKRFKDIFPELFDGSKADISFGTTSATRTAQTAVHFLREIDNYKPPGVSCSIDEFPRENTLDRSASDAINNDSCLKQFVGQFQNKTLSLHDTCDALTGGQITHLDYKLKLKDPQRTQSIAKSVSEKLKWATKNDKLTNEEVRAMYDVCRYESAIKRTMSVWCRYFVDADLKFFEYLSDVQDYFESAYGHPNLAKSACPITASLFYSFSRYIDSQAYGESIPDYKPEVHFHFTHSEVLQRVIAASVDLSKDNGYKLENILHHLEQGTVPKERQWQTSLFTPFSANLAFNFYECPRKPRQLSDAIPIDVSSGTSRYKIVASLNEHPIVLGGCQSHICDYNHLKENSTLVKNIPSIKSDTCDLEEFCHTKYVLT